LLNGSLPSTVCQGAPCNDKLKPKETASHITSVGAHETHGVLAKVGTNHQNIKKHMGVSKNGGTPKWMVYNGKPYFLMDDLGGNPPFLETPT